METDRTPPKLTPGAARLVALANERKDKLHHDTLCLHHWLQALLQRHGPMVEALVEDLDVKALAAATAERLARGDLGAPLDPDAVVASAQENAHRRGRTSAAERDLAASILRAAGVLPPADSTAAPAPPPRRPTPLLDRIAEDISAEVRERAEAVLGRDREVDLLVEALCRDTHRNAALIGPAGIGKRSVVAALAARIERDEVPAALAGAQVFLLQPAALLSGVSTAEELHRRFKVLTAEAGSGEVILVLESIGALLGAAGPAGLELGALLKAALSRRQLACVLSADEEQFRAFVDDAPSLEHSFQLIAVAEPSLEETLLIVKQRRDALQQRRNVSVSDEVVHWLVELAGRAIRHRRFPGKALDLLEQTAAHAIARGRKQATLEDAQVIAQRVTGLPLELDATLDKLERTLGDRGLLRPAEAAALKARLALTLRGADLRAARPNAVVLLLGEIAREARPLAEAIAEAVFQDAGRLISIDLLAALSTLEEASESAPSPAATWQAAALERLMQASWTVLVLENVHTYPPPLSELVSRALADGCLALGPARRIVLSDAVVLLAADVGAEAMRSARPVGFAAGDESSDPAGAARGVAEALLGRRLVEQCDFVWSSPARTPGGGWLEEWLTGAVVAQYQQRGLSLHFDPSAIQWLARLAPRTASAREWERLLDEKLAPLLVPYFGKAKPARVLAVCSENDQLVVRPR